MTQITTVSQAPSNAVRSHSHPVLEAGNLSFPNGQYVVDFKPGEDRSSFTLEHQIEGAALISRLLADKQAQYVCIVSSPISSYRRTHISDLAMHKVRWDTENLGESPLFTPMILCTASCELTISQKRDGVHSIWDGAHINFKKGSRLALGPVVRLQSSIIQLLSFRKDENLKNGTFFVDAETQPFRFLVNVSPDLHRFLHFEGEHQTRKNIMTHVVTACFALLQRDFAEDNEEEGWRTHRNLLALADFLESKGLQCWDAPEFRPEEVATTLYSHILPVENEEDEA